MKMDEGVFYLRRKIEAQKTFDRIELLDVQVPNFADLTTRTLRTDLAKGTEDYLIRLFRTEEDLHKLAHLYVFEESPVTIETFDDIDYNTYRIRATTVISIRHKTEEELREA